MSIRSNASTLHSVSDDTFTPSLLEKETTIAKWWFAARWSASNFCDSIEERLGCIDPWENEFEDTVTILKEAEILDEQASTKQGKVREYHTSKTRRNDSSRRATRGVSISNLERESPSFGSKGAPLSQHSRSFGSHSVSSAERSHSSTVAKSSFVTPLKMLSTYQSPSKPAPTKPTQTRGARMKAMQKSGRSKKIALGKQRARSTKESVNPRPKSIPYTVNHSVFHETLDSKKKRALGRRGVQE